MIFIDTNRLIRALPVQLFTCWTSNSRLFLMAMLVLACWLVVPAHADSAAQHDIVVITNHSVASDTYRRRTVRAIFGMRINTWPDGQPVTVFVRKSDSQAHLVFCRDILGMLPYRLTRNWDRLLFSGTGTIPEFVANDEEMLARVAETPGAIGYLTKEKLDDSVSVLEVK